MAFRLPDFNLVANLWTCSGTAVPADGPADYSNIPVQKYVASRAAWPVSPAWANGFFLQYHPPVQLRFPRVAPFDTAWNTWPVTAAEVPAGSGQYYRTFWQEVQHEGFVNEYALLIAVQCNDELQAIPPAGSIDLVGMGADPCGNVPPQDDIIANIPGGINCCAGSTPPPGDVLLDNFTDVANTEIDAHTTDSGQTYTESTPGIRIGFSGDFAEAYDSAAGNVLAIANYTGPEDGTLLGFFATNSDVTNPTQIGVLFRAQDFNNYNSLQVITDGITDYELELRERVAGVETVLATSASFSLSNDVSYVLSVVMTGDSMTCTISDDTPAVIGSCSASTSLLAGQTGVGILMLDDTLGGTWEFEQVRKDP